MKEALEDTWNITQVNQVLAYKEDNLAKSGKVQSSVVNFISFLWMGSCEASKLNWGSLILSHN